MKTVTMLYHDAVVDGKFDETGFKGDDADLYKLDVDHMTQHFAAIAKVREDEPADVHDLLENAEDGQWTLTFDDGGVTSITLIADILRERNWKAHFFITTDFINTPGFMNEDQIRQLHDKGHVIGSHSCSHPLMMGKYSPQKLRDEWSKSIERLSAILKREVRVASVPGGYFTRPVAEAAANCGIHALFTSEPTKRAYMVDACLVLGRYTVWGGMHTGVAQQFVHNKATYLQGKQYLFWNMKKMLKRLAGDRYLAIREKLLRKG